MEGIQLETIRVVETHNHQHPPSVQPSNASNTHAQNTHTQDQPVIPHSVIRPQAWAEISEKAKDQVFESAFKMVKSWRNGHEYNSEANTPSSRLPEYGFQDFNRNKPWAPYLTPTRLWRANTEEITYWLKYHVWTPTHAPIPPSHRVRWQVQDNDVWHDWHLPTAVRTCGAKNIRLEADEECPPKQLADLLRAEQQWAWEKRCLKEKYRQRMEEICKEAVAEELAEQVLVSRKESERKAAQKAEDLERRIAASRVCRSWCRVKDVIAASLPARGLRCAWGLWAGRKKGKPACAKPKPVDRKVPETEKFRKILVFREQVTEADMEAEAQAKRYKLKQRVSRHLLYDRENSWRWSLPAVVFALEAAEASDGKDRKTVRTWVR